MEVTFTGKISKVLELRSGDSKRNPGEKWYSQDYVFEGFDDWDNEHKYPRRIVFSVSGEDRIKRFNCELMMTTNEEVDVTLVLDSHEWNGKLFNDITAKDVRPHRAPQTAEEANAAPAQAQDNKDGLPY